jgi:hypothetical protein
VAGTEDWIPTGRTYRNGMFIEEKKPDGTLMIVGRYGGLVLPLEKAVANGLNPQPDSTES